MTDSRADEEPGNANNGKHAKPPPAAARETDQTLSEGDQTFSEGDQTAADGDQTAADTDQAAADTDQAAADADQAASDRDLEHGGDPEVHGATRELRDRSSQQRREGSQLRVGAASERDDMALARDLAAEERDKAAALRDRELETLDATQEREDLSALDTDERAARMAANRKRAAETRAAAAQARIQAADDRAQARHDREQAAYDRGQAQAKQEELLTQLANAEIDTLTGARARAPGLADLELEIDRARRLTGRLTVAYIDVVGLKAVNDAKSHAAGDALLRDVVNAVRSHLRTYDSIVRLGGDEFLCVVSGLSSESLRERFEAVQMALRTGQGRCEIKVGLAALRPDDDIERLIERADTEMPASPA